MDSKKLMEEMNSIVENEFNSIESHKALAKVLHNQFTAFKEAGFPENKAFALTQEYFDVVVSKLWRERE